MLGQEFQWRAWPTCCYRPAQYDFNGERQSYPDVRLVYWAGGNPFQHHQYLNRLRLAWSRPETVIVNDTWWTATARRADIVLPATTTLERNDVGAGARDRFIFAMHQAIDPVGASRHDFDIFSDLATRLGYAPAFGERRDARRAASARMPATRDRWRPTPAHGRCR
jgi:biotin/methionine sulfoxide reductase